MKKYITPRIEVVELEETTIVCSSNNNKAQKNPTTTCNRFCKIWHTCLDRDMGHVCYDKVWK